MSPELALVDPDAARRARERLELYDSAASTPRESTAVRAVDTSVRDRLVAAGADRELFLPQAPPAHEPWTEVDEGAASRARRRTFWAVAMTLLAALAGIAALALVPFRSRSENAEAHTALRVATTAPTKTTATTQGTKTVARRKTAPTQTAARARRATPPSAPKRSIRKAAQPRPQPTRTVEPTRTFVWPRVPRATRYRVEFFRHGRKIFQASPPEPRLVLPQQWRYKGRRFRLSRGTYRWRVRPVFGRSSTRLGRPITSSAWIVH